VRRFCETRVHVDGATGFGECPPSDHDVGHGFDNRGEARDSFVDIDYRTVVR
jgi:hypothetical protein